MAGDYLYKNVWLKNDADAERDAIVLWRANGGLPKDKTPQEYARELAIVAYDGGTLIATTTCRLGYIKKVRQNMAMFRLFIAPNHRRENISGPMTVNLFEAMGTYARENPQLRIGGMGAVVSARGHLKKPITPTGNLMLMGYSDSNHPMILKWFDHFRIDEEEALNRVPSPSKEDRYG
jgi:hypothetical protein